jgi:hypothetical protein
LLDDPIAPAVIADGDLMNLTLAAVPLTIRDHDCFLDAELEEACLSLATAQRDGGERFAIPHLDSVHIAMAEADFVHRTIARIARQRAHTLYGVRAKALALRSLLQSGETNTLHDDASAPDQLAWSLVQDLLASESPFIPALAVSA